MQRSIKVAAVPLSRGSLKLASGPCCPQQSRLPPLVVHRRRFLKGAFRHSGVGHQDELNARADGVGDVVGPKQTFTRFFSVHDRSGSMVPIDDAQNQPRTDAAGWSAFAAEPMLGCALGWNYRSHSVHAYARFGPGSGLQARELGLVPSGRSVLQALSSTGPFASSVAIAACSVLYVLFMCSLIGWRGELKPPLALPQP